MLKSVLIVVLVLLLSGIAVGSPKLIQKRRVHIPFLGLGPSCNGCPIHFCDDDPAIVFGYCCGCARFFDNLPVQCGPAVRCPLNNFDVCRDYEYMMHCCCQ